MMHLNTILEQAGIYFDGNSPRLAVKELKKAIKFIKKSRRKK